MIWNILLYFIVLIQKLQGYSVTNEPPKIKEFYPAVIDEPGSFIQFATTSEDIKNEMRCEAKNCDNIRWQYKLDVNSDWTVVPANLLSSTLINATNLFVSKLVEVDPTSADRSKLDGYYRCVSSNNQGNGYTTISPPLKLIYVDIIGPKVGGIEDAKAQTNKTAIVGQPYRLPCFRNSGPKLKPIDITHRGKAGLKFKWFIRRFGDMDDVIPINFNSNEYKNRLKMDPYTGDMYFAYLNSSDALNTDEFYICRVLTKGADGEVNLNKVKLSISASNNPILNSSVLYPKENDDKTVVCVEGSNCKVLCLFGGTDAVNGNIIITPPDSSTSIITRQQYGFDFTATESDQGIWACELHGVSTYTSASVSIQIDVLKKPQLKSTNQFTDIYVESGSDVTYVCDVENVQESEIEFYINGKRVVNNDPSYVEQSRPQELKIKNVQRAYSSNIVCMVMNGAGVMYKSVSLNVFTSPFITQFPNVDYLITSDTLVDGVYEFNCSFTLDSKTTGNSVKLYWKSSRKGLENRQIEDRDDEGVQAVQLVPYSADSNVISSTLELGFDSDTDEYLTNTEWKCVTEYQILDGDIQTIDSKPIRLTASSAPEEVEKAALWKYTWLVVGLVLGLILIIILVVLLNTYAKKNKGEQYFVDKHERKAGHNPEEEMQNYQFQDYKRPDQNPAIMSQISMNVSDKPIESDTGSIDEYRDISIGRFNEDGSVIYQYGQSQHHYQADV